MQYRLGIDVGGTNTDAVLIDENMQIIAELKRPTTGDIYAGILDVVKVILVESGVDTTKIKKAMLGTTQCTNAVVARKGLAKIAVLRLGAPASCDIKPMVDWADDLRTLVVESAIVGGGFEHDGKEIAPFDESAIRAFYEKIKGRVDSVAISCVFSAVRNDHELRATAICKEIMGDSIHISISSEIGSMGLVERENATVLNAMLHKVAERITLGFSNSLKELGITEADIYLSQNDGTLMTMEYARKYPVLTIACGPTNSIRGASYLSKLTNAIVVDVGGTTSDFGMLQKGFPRESSVAVTIGGVRTNFRMPDIVSVGLGGGSIVREKDGKITIGPDSVGYKISEKALVFGGDTLTTTDIAVRLGMADIGDKSKVAHIDESFAQRALDVIRTMTEENIDAIKVSGGDVDVILVGGGSVILPANLIGTKTVEKPDFFGVANAIGSAISKVSGTYEKLISYDKIPRDDALEQAKKEATQLAVEAGADPNSVEIIDVEDTPLAYYDGNTCRVKVKAAGDLQ